MLFWWPELVSWLLCLPSFFFFLCWDSVGSASVVLRGTLLCEFFFFFFVS